MTTATRPSHYYAPVSGTITPHRSRHYIWDTETLDDGPYDVMAMERALNGEPTQLNEAERYETARRLYVLLADHNATRRNAIVAERVGVSDRTIIRWADDGWPDRQFNPDGSRIAARPAETITERFASKTRSTDDGHLLWTGTLSPSGVPQFSYDRRKYLAARVAYQHHTGLEPAGTVRPACGNDLCVKAEHLEDKPSGRVTSPRRRQAAS